LVCRDIDLFEKFSNCAVGITVTTLNDEDRKLLEPNAPSIEERLAAVEKMSNEGIYSYIFFGPFYPTISESDLPAIVDKFIGVGAREIIIDSFHLKPGIWSSIEKRLPDDKKRIFKERIFDKNYRRQIAKELEKICYKKIGFQSAF
jgi:DNA repair photolyase